MDGSVSHHNCSYSHNGRYENSLWRETHLTRSSLSSAGRAVRMEAMAIVAKITPTITAPTMAYRLRSKNCPRRSRSARTPKENRTTIAGLFGRWSPRAVLLNCRTVGLHAASEMVVVTGSDQPNLIS